MSTFKARCSLLSNYFNLLFEFDRLDSQVKKLLVLDTTLLEARKKIRRKLTNCFNRIPKFFLTESSVKKIVKTSEIQTPINCQLGKGYVLIKLENAVIGVGLSNQGNKNLLKSRKKDYICHIKDWPGPLISVNNQNCLPVASTLALICSKHDFTTGMVLVTRGNNILISKQNNKYSFKFKQFDYNLVSNKQLYYSIEGKKLILTKDKTNLSLTKLLDAYSINYVIKYILYL